MEPRINSSDNDLLFDVVFQKVTKTKSIIFHEIPKRVSNEINQFLNDKFFEANKM